MIVERELCLVCHDSNSKDHEIQNIYDSNSKQPKLPIVDVPSTFLDTDGKCFIYSFFFG